MIKTEGTGLEVKSLGFWPWSWQAQVPRLKITSPEIHTFCIFRSNLSDPSTSLPVSYAPMESCGGFSHNWGHSWGVLTSGALLLLSTTKPLCLQRPLQNLFSIKPSTWGVSQNSVFPMRRLAHGVLTRGTRRLSSSGTWLDVLEKAPAACHLLSHVIFGIGPRCHCISLGNSFGSP